MNPSPKELENCVKGGDKTLSYRTMPLLTGKTPEMCNALVKYLNSPITPIITHYLKK
jgi:hypothetical protein